MIITNTNGDPEFAKCLIHLCTDAEKCTTNGNSFGTLKWARTALKDQKLSIAVQEQWRYTPARGDNSNVQIDSQLDQNTMVVSTWKCKIPVSQKDRARNLKSKDDSANSRKLCPNKCCAIRRIEVMKIYALNLIVPTSTPNGTDDINIYWNGKYTDDKCKQNEGFNILQTINHIIAKKIPSTTAENCNNVVHSLLHKHLGQPDLSLDVGVGYWSTFTNVIEIMRQYGPQA